MKNTFMMQVPTIVLAIINVIYCWSVVILSMFFYVPDFL